MTKKEDDFLTPSTKKIRFRGDLNSYYFDNHIEDIFDDPERRKLKHSGDQCTDENHKKGKVHDFFNMKWCCVFSLVCFRMQIV